ncbi:MAG: hypothetical protein GY756_06180 [bacterium]|nr:hypothetical protein [bacterium]
MKELIIFAVGTVVGSIIIIIASDNKITFQEINFKDNSINNEEEEEPSPPVEEEI